MENTEKVSVNMNVATLSQIDLLTDLGYYSNRSDFINQAVREALDKKQSIIEKETNRNLETDTWFLGISTFPEETLQKARAMGKKLKIRGYGIAVIDTKDDQLALDAIESISVKGKVVASQAVKDHFSLKP